MGEHDGRWHYRPGKGNPQRIAERRLCCRNAADHRMCHYRHSWASCTCRRTKPRHGNGLLRRNSRRWWLLDVGMLLGNGEHFFLPNGTYACKSRKLSCRKTHGSSLEFPKMPDCPFCTKPNHISTNQFISIMTEKCKNYNEHFFSKGWYLMQ